MVGDYVVGMETRARRVVFVGPVVALVATGLSGCRESPSAVERAESAAGPTVTVTGAVDVGPSAPADGSAEIVLRFYDPPDTAVVEERQLLWSGDYRVEFFHGLVCDWTVNVTIWDGRTSERKPVAPDPPDRCQGFLQGPDFWFP